LVDKKLNCRFWTQHLLCVFLMEAVFMVAFKSALFAGKQVTVTVVVVAFFGGPEPERIRMKI
jgi:hypothetical protein